MSQLAIIDCQALACQGGLRYVNSFDRGIHRRRCGRGFRYLTATGEPLCSDAIRKRIELLAIPPAWQDVWICPDADGHIQAVGRDALGRKQYVYHPRWHELSAATKFERMLIMPRALSRIRATVRRHLDQTQLSKERVVAAIVRVLDKAHIRVGNEQYARERDSRGATTLTSEHIRVDQFTVSLDFPGKSGVRNEIAFTDRKVARLIRQCEEIDGHYLFSYFDETGNLCQATSSDVNEYLRAVSQEPITAKDFRTWWASVTAFDELALLADQPLNERERKRAAVTAIRRASRLLGNTLAVCRRSYVHPLILESFEQGALANQLKRCRTSPRAQRELAQSECAFWWWLKSVCRQQKIAC